MNNVQESVDRTCFTPVASSPSASPTSVLHVGRRVLQLLRYSRDAAFVVNLVSQATDGAACVVGGVIRRTLFGRSAETTLAGDLDFLLPDGDVRAFAALDALGVPFDLNRSHHRRYRFRGIQAEFFHPSSFYCGFADIASTVAFFDLRINSFGVELGSGRIVDPSGMLIQSLSRDPGINWRRWSVMPPVELAVLALRLFRIAGEIPSLQISAADCCRLRRDIMPAVESADWTTIEDRHPGGKKTFIPMFEALLRKRGVL